MGVAFHDPILLAVASQRVFRVRVSKRGGDIFAAEQNLAFVFDGADNAELRVLENLHIHLVYFPSPRFHLGFTVGVLLGLVA